MSDIAIKVEKLSKRYRIGQSTNGYKTLRDSLAGLATAPFRRKMSAPSHIQKSISNSTSTSALASLRSDEIWALKEVSFEVKPGEVVGVIGRNGAGKSTLLKILSRITEPTEGCAEIHGRVGSLLEVGTGFHPELTGRENIYINGAVLGMTKAEVHRTFDEIVAFAEVERFIDTPVKRYSSGMYVRLAFAVAAHLEPEILLVDEVLAVGDAAFQKKCLGKMDDVTHEGRTILFVSHNMAAISALCTTCVLLRDGQIAQRGHPGSVIRNYLDRLYRHGATVALDQRRDRTGSGRLRLTKFHLEDANTGQRVDVVQSGQDVTFAFGYEREDKQQLRDIDIGFSVSDQLGHSLFVIYSSFTHADFGVIPQMGEFRCRVDRLPLSPGEYALGARVLVASEEADFPNVIAQLSVVEGDFFGTGSPGLKMHSAFLVDGRWAVRRTQQ